MSISQNENPARACDATGGVSGTLRFRDARPGPLHQLRQVDSDRSVADIHPAEAGDPSPATGSDHNDTAEASTPVAMTPVAVMATTLAPAAGGSFGRDERGGADGGDGGDSEKRLADHGSLLGLIGCVLTSCLVRRANDPSGSTAQLLLSLCESQIDHFVMAITSGGNHSPAYCSSSDGLSCRMLRLG